MQAVSNLLFLMACGFTKESAGNLSLELGKLFFRKHKFFLYVVKNKTCDVHIT